MNLLIALRRLGIAALAGASMAANAQSPASTYPDRPIKFIVGFTPGGSSDIVARLVAPKLSAALGQPVVVENRVGAGGVIAAELVAKAPPDGLTWLIVPSGHATLAAMRKTLPFDAVRDFSWISTITTYPMVIGVKPDSPYKTFSELLSTARESVGRLSYSSLGVGTGHHLLGELLNAEAKAEMTHVPFKGSSAALIEVASGRVDLLLETMTFALPQVQSGRIRALAVTSAKPFPLLPNVPLAKETLPGVEYESWLGIAAAPNTPRPIVERLNAELRKVLAQADVQQKLVELGGQPTPSSPEEFRDRVQRDVAKFNSIVDGRKMERQ
ncbi:MAG: Bug family tripartite tricarboxylate transporter substrate binding protein [Burkholderiaceae bacterium]